MGKLSLVTIAGFACGALGAKAVCRYGSRVALLDIPNERSSHTVPTPRGGGVGLWLAFVVVGIFFAGDKVFTLYAGLVGLLGLLEDRFSFPPRLRLFMQFILSGMVVIRISGIFPASAVMAILFLLWVIFITGTANFYNFMDGINGIAGLTGVVAFGLLFFFSSVIIHDSDIALMSLVLSAGCLGFLPFNFPKAKVFMGDVGSVLLGFVFASFVMKLSSSIHLFLCLVMFLSPFYADALVTLYDRWRRGEHLTSAHRSHLYQYLCNELGLPHWQVASIYAVFQTFWGVMAIMAYRYGLIWQVAVFVTFAVLFVIFYKLLKGIQPAAIATSPVKEMSR